MELFTPEVEVEVPVATGLMTLSVVTVELEL
jgi:hypothetical protein